MLESHLPGPGSRKRTNAGVTNLGLTKRATSGGWRGSMESVEDNCILLESAAVLARRSTRSSQAEQKP